MLTAALLGQDLHDVCLTIMSLTLGLLAGTGRLPLASSPHRRGVSAPLHPVQHSAKKKDDAMMRLACATYSLRVPQPQMHDQTSYLSAAVSAIGALQQTPAAGHISQPGKLFSSRAVMHCVIDI